MAPKAGKAKPKAKGDKKKKEEKGAGSFACEGIVLGISKWFSEREANCSITIVNCLWRRRLYQFRNNLLFADFHYFFSFFVCVIIVCYAGLINLIAWKWN